MEEIRFQDHFPFSEKDIDDIRQRMKAKHISLALTTEKDAVKIAEWVRPEDSIWAVALDVESGQGGEAITALLQALPWSTTVAQHSNV